MTEKMNWFEGYVGEDEYVPGYYENLSPVFLNYCGLARGYNLGDYSKPFTYLDIACGQGISLVSHAALFPDSQFYGIDLSPSHIAKARNLAEECKVANVTFIEGGVSDLLDIDLPDMDYVVTQGIYSWLSKENQGHIIDFLDKRLSSGGIFHVHYMVYPSALSSDIVPRLLHEISNSISGTNKEKLEGALTKLRRFTDLKVGFFSDSENLKKQLERHKQQNLQYLAHDLLSKDRQGHFFTEMARELERAKLSYVAHTSLHRSFGLDLLFPPYKELQKPWFDKEYVETLRDYINPENVRRDIFQRGEDRLDLLEMGKNFQSQRFVRMVSTDKIKKEVRSPQFAFQLGQELIDKLKPLLDKNRYFTGGDLQETLEGHRSPYSQLNKLLSHTVLLTIAGYIKPCRVDVDNYEKVRKHTQTFNSHVAALHISDSNVSSLAAPMLGFGVHVNNIERKMIDDILRGEDNYAGSMVDLFKKNNFSITFTSPKVESKDANMESDTESTAESTTEEDKSGLVKKVINKDNIEEYISEFDNSRLPMLKEVGII